MHPVKVAFREWMEDRMGVDWRAGASWCTAQKLAALVEGWGEGGRRGRGGSNLLRTVLEGRYLDDRSSYISITLSKRWFKQVASQDVESPENSF